MTRVQRVNVPGIARLPGFCHATVAAGQVVVGGLLGTLGESLSLVSGGAEAEARQAMRNLHAVLLACGSNMAHVQKVTIYLVDLADMPVVNSVYDACFEADQVPARIALGVGALALGARVEIDALARVA